MFRSWMIAILCTLGATLFGLTACGDDDDGGGATRFTGSIILPGENQCSGCTAAGVPLVVAALRQDADPLPVATVTTDAAGNYATGDLRGQLGVQRAVILLAGVSDTAIIGGVESARSGTNDKDFDVGTQVACLAAVMMTSGTASFGDPGCVVRPVCGPSDPPGCFSTIPPELVDGERIGNLERFAALFEDRVVLPDDQGRAACTVISCTLGGSGRGAEECLRGTF